MSSGNIIESSIQIMRGRSLPEGGFAMYDNEDFRPDATAWAVLALEAFGSNRDLTIPAGRRLAASQHSDGRISVIKSHPEAFWPTALSVLAWKKLSAFEVETESAVRFILATTGKHWIMKDHTVVGHDTSIRGWPWIANTHSWIEPTSLAVLALKVCGYSEHERTAEAVRMILDRQLLSGGWNVGASEVFGNQLLPIPECTGHALSALADQTKQKRVNSSLDYLRHETDKLKTPLALSWAIFGLTAWSYQPPDIHRRILDSFALQEKYGVYDTTLLAQLVVAYLTSGHFMGLYQNSIHHG